MSQVYIYLSVLYYTANMYPHVATYGWYLYIWVDIMSHAFIQRI